MFLLDRSADASPVGLKWKYGILESLHRSASFTAIFSEEQQLKVVQYLRVGVIFVPRQTQVAYEHQS